MKGRLTAFLLVYLSSIAVVPAYAETDIEVHNGEVQSSNSNSETIVEVQNKNASQHTTIVKTEVVTVVVTATQMPSLTLKPYRGYKAVKKVVQSTPTPTFNLTATPSATKVPPPTKKLSLKATVQNPNIFQRIIRFFQSIIHFT